MRTFKRFAVLTVAAFSLASAGYIYAEEPETRYTEIESKYLDATSSFIENSYEFITKTIDKIDPEDFSISFSISEDLTAILSYFMPVDLSWLHQGNLTLNVQKYETESYSSAYYGTGTLELNDAEILDYEAVLMSDEYERYNVYIKVPILGNQWYYDYLSPDIAEYLQQGSEILQIIKAADLPGTETVSACISTVKDLMVSKGSFSDPSQYENLPFEEEPIVCKEYSASECIEILESLSNSLKQISSDFWIQPLIGHLDYVSEHFFSEDAKVISALSSQNGNEGIDIIYIDESGYRIHLAHILQHVDIYQVHLNMDELGSLEFLLDSNGGCTPDNYSFEINPTINIGSLPQKLYIPIDQYLADGNYYGIQPFIPNLTVGIQTSDDAILAALEDTTGAYLTTELRPANMKSNEMIQKRINAYLNEPYSIYPIAANTTEETLPKYPLGLIRNLIAAGCPSDTIEFFTH